MCSGINSVSVKKRKFLPIWNQSFSLIREGKNENLYIDKTKEILNIINSWNNQKLFFSRPRRFWKSLLISTLKSLYEWKKELFYDTYAENNWDFEKTNPVIKISFWSGTVKDREYLQESLRYLLEKNAIEFEIKLSWVLIKDNFYELLEKIYLKTWKKVVVLIDEYDKAILDNIDKTEIALELREELKWFYGTLKDADEFLEFVFITWVSKFSKVSLFSGLNNLTDLSLDPIAWELVWFTEQEITDNLEDYLDWVDRKKMKLWYNGFNFLWENKVYNPYDVLLFLKNKEYKAHWFETATPSFLIKLLKNLDNFYPIPDLQNITSWEKLLWSFDIENINLETLLFQTWYLTIKEKKNWIWGIQYKLKVPNKEISQSLNDYLITDYLWAYKNTEFLKRAEPIYESLLSWNIEDLIKYLKILFANISYTNSLEKIAKYEWYYSSVIYTLFYAMWLDVIQEDITNQGRIDLTIKLEDKIFIIEFKVEKSWLNALEQIKEKKYSEKYSLSTEGFSPLIYEIWINFNFEDRNIESYEFEKLN